MSIQKWCFCDFCNKNWCFCVFSLFFLNCMLLFYVVCGTLSTVEKNIPLRQHFVLHEHLLRG